MDQETREFMEFIRQSIESHDRQLGEMIERMENRDAAWNEKIIQMDTRIESLVATTELNFQRLSTAMLGLADHVATHQKRIESLERQ